MRKIAILASVLLVASIAVAGPATQAGASPGFSLSPASQDNAARTAQQYLDMEGFSRQGLIKQLEYDSYSEDDAEAAVDTITVDWNAQAVKSAKQYLGMEGFSYGGLVKQLEYDGYTDSQAEYGATGAGA